MYIYMYIYIHPIVMPTASNGDLNIGIPPLLMVIDVGCFVMEIPALQ